MSDVQQTQFPLLSFPFNLYFSQFLYNYREIAMRDVGWKCNISKT